MDLGWYQKRYLIRWMKMVISIGQRVVMGNHMERSIYQKVKVKFLVTFGV